MVLEGVQLALRDQTHPLQQGVVPLFLRGKQVVQRGQNEIGPSFCHRVYALFRYGLGAASCRIRSSISRVSLIFGWSLRIPSAVFLSLRSGASALVQLSCLASQGLLFLRRVAGSQLSAQAFPIVGQQRYFGVCGLNEPLHSGQILQLISADKGYLCGELVKEPAGFPRLRRQRAVGIFFGSTPSR